MTCTQNRACEKLKSNDSVQQSTIAIYLPSGAFKFAEGLYVYAKSTATSLYIVYVKYRICMQYKAII